MESKTKFKKVAIIFVGIFLVFLIIIGSRSFLNDSDEAYAKGLLSMVYTVQDSAFRNNGQYLTSADEVANVLPRLESSKAMKIYFNETTVSQDAKIGGENLPFLDKTSYRILVLRKSLGAKSEGWTINEKREIKHFSD